MAPRSLFRLVPFDESLPSLHETDWLLRATTLDGVGLQLASETLAIWNASEDRPRITRVSGHDLPYAHLMESNEWAWAWARRHRRLFTPRAYAAFLTSVLSYMASVDGEWRLACPILTEAVRHGSPKGIDLLVFGMMWSIPYGARRWVRDAVLGTWRVASRARTGKSGRAHTGLSPDGDDAPVLTHLRDDGAPI